MKNLNIPQKLKETANLKQLLFEREILIKDINSINDLALNNRTSRQSIWNLRTINSQLIELKENNDKIINYLNS